MRGNDQVSQCDLSVYRKTKETNKCLKFVGRGILIVIIFGLYFPGPHGNQGDCFSCMWFKISRGEQEYCLMTGL